VVNRKLGGIGKMTQLSIDTKKRACRLSLDLVGEDKPIEIHVIKYDLQMKGDKATVTVVDASASREWITGALRTFVVGKSFEVPAPAGALLKLMA